MTLLNRTITLIIMATSLVILNGCAGKSIRTAIEIDAPRERVYDILADLQAYSEWNPYHRRVQGDFSEGAALSVDIIRPDGKEVHVPPHMMRIEPYREITWGGGIHGIFYGEHRFLLSTTDRGTTLLEHNEDFTGFAINFADLPEDVIADGYHQMNLALKQRAESVTEYKTGDRPCLLFLNRENRGQK